MPELKIPKENVLGLAFEPIQFLNMTPKFVNYAMKHIGKYLILIGDVIGLMLPPLFVSHFGYLWYSMPPKEITIKRSIMSIVVSKKTLAPGHMYRHKLIAEIIKRKLPIDIYGNGSSKYSYKTVKGAFNDVEPYENYAFTVCIENYKSDHYFFGKIITPLLHNCMPVYVNLLMDILKNPSMHYRPTYNDKNKKTVNLIENIERLFS